MNQLENWQARYHSNTWMSGTSTDVPDEFEPLKFDCYIQGTPGEVKINHSIQTIGV